jgi:predicted nucleotidyltransferase
MTGREIARRAHVSQQAARTVLDDLETQGLVSVREVPPSYLYELNREHVAAPVLEALVHLRESLFARVREHVHGWSPPPASVTVFGSVARGDATATSDLDLLIVRPDRAGPEFTYWEVDVPRLADAIRRWSGNAAEILEYSEREIRERWSHGDRVLAAVRREGRTLFGATLDELTLHERLPADAAQDR